MKDLVMPWPRQPIAELCSEIVDCVNRTAPTVNYVTPYKMIRTTNVKAGFIDLNEVKYVDEKTYNSWTRRQTPKRGDVLLTREAPLGEVGMLRSDEPVFLGQRLVSYRANPLVADAAFLFYMLRGADLQTQIRAFGAGSTVEHMRVPDAKRLLVPTPPLALQQRIGAILGAYDDLIEVNRRRIALSEEMARRLFDEWFVRLRYPGHENVPVQDTPDGPMPEGWGWAELSAVARVNAASLRPNKAPDTISYVDIASVSPGRIEKAERLTFGEAPGRARRIVRDGSIIWAMVRPNRRGFALVLSPDPDLIVSTGFAVLDATTVPFSYLYGWVTTNTFVSYLTNHATGAAYPAVTGATFERARVLVPAKAVCDVYARYTEPSLRLADALLRANDRLAAARDLLLPRLLSGQLSVAAAERTLEDAA